MIRITCSILCYNYGRFLAQAIESCLNQTPGDYKLEILVIDDGSTDNTPEVCARYASRIRVFRSANEGFGSSLTKAVKLSTGEYTLLLDADDYFHSDKVVTLLPMMASKPLFIRHKAFWVDEFGHAIDNESHVCPTSAMCLRRDAALSLLPVPNEIHFLILDLPRQSVHLEDSLTYYRRHRGSMQRNPAPGVWHMQIAADNRSMVNRIDSLLARPPLWLESRQKLLELRAEAEITADFAALEASLQLGQRLSSFRKCCRYVATVLRNGKADSLLCKMILRSLLGIPVYRPGRL
jgi:glycosyltransferase involved in cell wall biosynthesis